MQNLPELRVSEKRSRGFAPYVIKPRIVNLSALQNCSRRKLCGLHFLLYVANRKSFAKIASLFCKYKIGNYFVFALTC